MRPLRYSINTTLDGCVDHREGVPEPQMHKHAERMIAEADALILGRTTYLMMEEGWRDPDQVAAMPEWMQSFATAIGAAKKYVVSGVLTEVDWNAELLGGDLRQAVTELKNRPGNGLYVGGVQLPTALAQWGLIDEYQFLVHPRVIGHGPRLFDGLEQPIDLTLVGREEFRSGAMVLRYRGRE
ncbi:dihydrofolate reductase family protein [Gordonia liuliyuniae]|uniref:Dihydrofolate reductase family protein n=1 Tax=Gordonia liuliyuniae TaxID=2911517 RepID=A0ABS9INN0_9ACTN|nr:dihydrofolate reductase family protein [Gordonia liuliyuniae]MCF8587161.1 dihydrofolate reductase family protein [Gordonia liuliyuniae]